MILLLCVLFLVPLIAVAFYNARHAPRLENLSAPPPDGEDVFPPTRVSLLVPLVDKIDFAALLRALARNTYAPTEILFALDPDDGQTALHQAVDAFVAASDGKARVLPLQLAPVGWRRANWAAHHLAAAAQGDLLIFCAAELSVGPDAVAHTVEACRALGAECLGALPRWICDSWAERALLPFVRDLPVSTLFLLHRQPALPVSPEWLAVTREAYAASGGHLAVPLSPVAEGAIAHRVRTRGKSVTVVATADLSWRTGRGWRAVWEALVERVYLLAGGRETTFLALEVLSIGAFVLPWVAVLIWAPGALAALLVLVALRLVVAAIFESPGFDAVAHPLGALLVPVLLVDSYRRGRKAAAPVVPVAPAMAEDVGTDGA